MVHFCESNFNSLLEAASLNEAELADYCRQKGLYVEQIAAWRKASLQANDDSPAQAKARREQSMQDLKQIKKLEQELRQKDKALAEAARSRTVRHSAVCRPVRWCRH